MTLTNKDYATLADQVMPENGYQSVKLTGNDDSELFVHFMLNVKGDTSNDPWCKGVFVVYDFKISDIETEYDGESEKTEFDKSLFVSALEDALFSKEF